MSSVPPGWYTDPNDAAQQRYHDGTAWTDVRRPASTGFSSPAAPPAPPARYVPSAPPPPRLKHTATGRWYFVITVCSAGLLAAVPFFHGASRLERPSLRRVGVGFIVSAALTLTLVGIAPEDASGTATGWTANLGGALALLSILVASVLLIGVRREVYQAGPAPAPSANDTARATVGQARQRRAEARELARTDPMMARELGIGVPGSGRYDDGGLLDLNRATADQLRDLCGLAPELAHQIVGVRGELGRFLSVDDVVVYGQLPEDAAELVRERGVVIG